MECKIFEPTKDWKGIGYLHWMITTNICKITVSGVGHSVSAAWNDLKHNLCIYNISNKND